MLLAGVLEPTMSDTRAGVGALPASDDICCCFARSSMFFTIRSARFKATAWIMKQGGQPHFHMKADSGCSHYLCHEQLSSFPLDRILHPCGWNGMPILLPRTSWSLLKTNSFKEYHAKLRYHQGMVWKKNRNTLITNRRESAAYPFSMAPSSQRPRRAL